MIGLGAAGATIKLAAKAGLCTKIASLAWTAGRAGSSKANLLKHFDKHGAEMGYRSPLSYTIGAYSNKMRAVVQHTYRNGSTATMSSSLRLTVASKGRIVTHFRPTYASNYWMKNVLRR